MFDPETNETGPLCVRVGNPNTLCRFQCLGETIGANLFIYIYININVVVALNYGSL